MENLELRQKVDLCRGPLKEESQDATSLTVCLIEALTTADFIDPELTVNAGKNSGAHLGVLTLAAILREKEFKAHVVNLDELFLAFLRHGKTQPAANVEEPANLMPAMTGNRIKASELEQPVNFFSYVVEHLKSLSFDVFGFSSICSSYPLTLRLAQEVKRLHPDASIILGGPQASVVDVPTMHAFPCIDFIIRGEADETFPALLDLLSRTGPHSWESIPGITFRRGSSVIRNHNAPVFLDLDRLPLPAFDLDPTIKDCSGIYLEIGRGCPFACTFCSTNDFFRRNFRLKSPRKMIEEMEILKQEYEIDYFSMVHDMYTIDRKKVVAFCQALLECGAKFTWGCSARTDCIDDELIGLMAETGCRGIFFGIETGSSRLQSVINKKLDLVESKQRIQCADRYGIDTAVALIIGFPDETRDDLRDTIHFFVDSLRFDHAQPQLSLLAPLAATPIHEQYKEQLIFDHIFSDMSHQGWWQDPADVEMIKAYPEIFPNFYAVPTMWLDRGYLKEIMGFVTYLAMWFRWLPVALLQDSGDFLEVFDRWRRWLAERSAGDSNEGTCSAPDYSHQRFRKDFLEFVRTCYLAEMATARVAIAALGRMEDASLWNARKGTSEPGKITDRLEANSVPCRLDNLLIMDLEVDYKELIESLRNKADLSCVSERTVTVVFLPTEQRLIQVWQLASLSATLLRLCDGRRTVHEIVQEFSLLEAGVEGVPTEKVCLFGLTQLRKDGFISLSSCPVVAEG
jgi:radical SAM superfamily enzyme YgiQ (UPF0313 family)